MRSSCVCDRCLVHAYEKAFEQMRQVIQAAPMEKSVHLSTVVQLCDLIPKKRP